LILKIENSLFLATDFSSIHLLTLLPVYFSETVILLVYINCCILYAVFKEESVTTHFLKP
jgi:Na+/glutamate symporter